MQQGNVGAEVDGYRAEQGHEGEQAGGQNPTDGPTAARQGKYGTSKTKKNNWSRCRVQDATNRQTGKTQSYPVFLSTFSQT